MTPNGYLVAALPLAGAGFFELLNDTRALGQATLIAVAAIIVGVMVRRFWPKSMYPVMFGALAGLGVVAALAAAGIPQAGLVLWLGLGVAAVLLVLAIIFN